MLQTLYTYWKNKKIPCCGLEEIGKKENQLRKESILNCLLMEGQSFIYIRESVKIRAK